MASRVQRREIETTRGACEADGERTGVLARDAGEDGVEVALGERAAVEQRLQQGVVPPRQRRHAPARGSPGGKWEPGTRIRTTHQPTRRIPPPPPPPPPPPVGWKGGFWGMEDSVGVSREAQGRRQAKQQPYAAGPGKEGNGCGPWILEWAGPPACRIGLGSSLCPLPVWPVWQQHKRNQILQNNPRVRTIFLL